MNPSEFRKTIETMAVDVRSTADLKIWLDLVSDMLHEDLNGNWERNLAISYMVEDKIRKRLGLIK